MHRLITKKPLEEDGVLYYSNTYKHIDSNTYYTHIKLVDDRNIDAPTLGQRRLIMQSRSAPLYNMRSAIFFLGDFLKMALPNYWFIDSNGLLFQYKKQLKAKLVFRKITKVIPGRSTGSIIEVQGIPERFKTIFTVNSNMRYAGILEHKGINILYSVYPEQYKDSWRLI